MTQFKRKHPRRYQPVPTILEKTAENMAYTITSVCGKKHPKIREAAVRVDFKGKTPVAQVMARYYRKGVKVFEFPLELPGGFDFQAVV